MRRGWMLALLLGLGCDDPPAPHACGALPEASACPSRGGGTCSDRDCSAIYACFPEGWKLIERCSSGQGGAAGAAGNAGSAGVPEVCTQALQDPGACSPLVAPDCNATLLEGCEVQACQLGCDGFLRCEQGEWSERYVAYCTEDGELIKP